ncbi:MAG TPA: Ku protein [Parasegetibacter sp.]
MRPIWTGAIGFGLVNIPVKLYSATDSSALDFDMLDKKDHSNIKYQRVNEKTGKEVPWGNIVKGYKLNEKYVVLDKKDFEAANAKKTKTIEINEFVKESEINTTLFETPYYLAPDKSGTRAYALLREALEKTGKAGVATFVLRNKESLAILRTSGDVIILNRLRFPEEIRDTSDLKLPAKKGIKKAELEMAVTLINQLTAKFNPGKYKDTYTDQLLKFIRAKAKGTKPKASGMKVVHRRSDDLIDVLKASLNKKRKKAS